MTEHHLDTEPTVRVHTAEVRGFDHWQDTVTGSLMRFDVDCVRPDTFYGRVSQRSLADVSLIGMTSGPHMAHRGGAEIRPDDQPEYVLSLQLAGRAEIAQDGRSAKLCPGDLAYYDSTRPVSVVSGAGYRSLCIKFPRSRMRTRGDLTGELTATTMECNQGLTPMVAGLMTGLYRSLEEPSAHRAVFDVAQQTVDLVRTVILGELQARGIGPRDEHHVLLDKIHQYIDLHLGDPELSPRQIATAHFISPRQLHSLFEHEDMTVAATIRFRRLERCRADLTDPLQADTPVAAIATRWGFRSPTRLGQICKTATGLTPAQLRNASLGRGGHRTR